MYPDLNETEREKPLVYGETIDKYGYGSYADQKPEKVEGAGIKCSKCWIAVVGFLSALIGFAISGTALYARFGYSHWNVFSIFMPENVIWTTFAFGVILAVCGIVVVIAALKYQNKCYKVVLVVFSVVLILLCLAEIAGGIIFVVFLTGNTLSDVPEGDIVHKNMIDYRNQVVNKTYDLCCHVLHPPYTNETVVDEICLWPKLSKNVQSQCAKAGYSGYKTSTSIYNCVCKEDVAWYGKQLGGFFSERFMWVGGLGIGLAIVTLVAVICSCVLICKRQYGFQTKYANRGFDSSHMN